MTALLQAELLKLRTTRTFAAVVASAAALSLTLVVLGAALGKETKPHALFTNSAITYIIVILAVWPVTLRVGRDDRACPCDAAVVVEARPVKAG